MHHEEMCTKHEDTPIQASRRRKHGWRKCRICHRIGKLETACTDCLDKLSEYHLSLDPEAGGGKAGRQPVGFELPPTEFLETQHA